MQRKYEDIPQKHHQAEDDSCLVFAEPKLRYTPYYQGLFCLKHHQARQGICSGLVFDEVTEYNNGIQGQALMAHLRNSQRWKEHVYSFGSTTTKAGVSVVLGEGYVRETKLSGVESKVEEAASVEQVIESIKKQSDDFQKPVTFLCGIKM